MSTNWTVKTSTIDDFNRWLDFIKLVQYDFHNINLVEDNKFLSSIKKHIKKSTALYVENDKNQIIIGTLLYTKKKSHIDCLAVHPEFRRKGIASSLLNYVFSTNPEIKTFQVKTFIKSDSTGNPAREFYKKHGFVPQYDLYIDKKYGHTSQLFLKNK